MTIAPISDEQSETGNTVTDAQCYRYNGLARLTEAWTASGGCETTSISTGAGSYRQSFTYNAIGDRTEVVDHGVNGAADIVTTYINGCSASCNRTGAQPHTLTETKGGADPTKFVYDVAGNLLTRTATSGKNQTLTWDDEGRLTQVVSSGGTTKYLYDADGNQLIRRDPGKTTLFAGDTEIVADTSTSPAALLGAVRTYVHGGTAVAMRSTLPDGGTHYLFSDFHGTSTLSMDTTTQQVSRQQFKPYGEDRATANTTLWPDMTRGYLGKPRATATGYTDIGARKYDPALGRFISADPILEPTDLSQLGGYNYAGDNPISRSDPSGLADCDYAYGCGQGGENSQNPTQGGGGKPGGGRKDSDKPSNPNDPEDGCTNCGVGANTTTGTRTEPPKFAEYAIIKTGYCYSHMATKCHITDLDNAEITRAMAYYMCEYYSSCAFRDALIAESDQRLSDIASWIPYLGIPDTIRSMKQDWDAGNYASVAIQTASLLPWGGVVAKGGGKIASKLLKKGDCSFSGDTEILLADGTTKPFNEVQVGDEVLATDPETGEQGPRKVEKVWVHEDDLYIITIDGQRLVTTEDHPFWNETDKKWQGAEGIDPGDRVRTPTGTARVDSFDQRRYARDLAYNLTVADIRTYYVLAGNTPVLVHNCGKDQGIYEFPDMHNPGKTYVGKSINLTNRLGDHLRSGRLASMDDVKVTHVCGCEDDVFVAEHLRIQQLRKQGVPLSNDINSPGKAILDRRNQPMLPGAEDWGQ